MQLAAQAGGTGAARFQARVLHWLRLGSQRHDRAHGAALLGADGPAASATSSSAAATPTTAARWPARRWAAWRACTRRAACRSRASPHRASPAICRTWRRGMTRSRVRPASRPAGWKRRSSTLGPDKVAAFIGEPVQGAGGVIIPPPTYWPRNPAHLRQVRHPAGGRRSHLRLRPPGRLVRLRAHGHAARPDRLRQGRHLGLRAAGRGAGGRPGGATCWSSSGGDFNHGFTYSGHPVACAAALENIRIMEEEGLVERVAHDTGPYLKAAFARWRRTRWSGTPKHRHVGRPEPGAAQGRRPCTTARPSTATLGVGMMCRGTCSTTA